MIDSTARYLSRVLPPPWQILGVRLLPFTLGHAHALASASTWRPFEEFAVTEEFLGVGMWVASRPWRQAIKGFGRRSDLFSLFLGARARLGRVDLAEKTEVFAEYLAYHTSGPSVRNVPRVPVKYGAPVSASRPAGAPVLARLRVFAMSDLGLGAAAMDLPFADVYWLWATHKEAAGAIWLLNDEETAGMDSFDEFCRREEEKRRATCGT